MGQTGGGTATTATERSAVTMIDPRAPRFGQTITMSGLLAGIALQAPLLIVAVAVSINGMVLSGWRLNLYGFVWQVGMIPLLGRPEETEPAAPHRFANVMGAGMSAVAALLLLGAPALNSPLLALAGYGVAVVHAAMAAIGGIGDYCIGCRMYRQVAFFRRLGVV